VGVTGHLEICSDVTVMGKSVVAKHVLRPGVYAGIPIRPIAQWKKAIARLNALARTSGSTESSDD
jgi:UDP-3-O-[3-hydroxymyristoyl] glucosamine N-acyltransferase